jgi:16S rRNA processing protein RimM
MIKIGEIVNVVGLRGELKIYPYCENKERFETLNKIYFNEEQRVIEHVRYKDNLVVLKVQGIDDRNLAEKYKGTEVFMSDEELPELPQGTYYVKDIIGFPVEDRCRGAVGVLKDVRDNGPQSLFVIEKTNGVEFLVPAVEEFFIGVDRDRKVILVDLIEGMYED